MAKTKMQSERSSEPSNPVFEDDLKQQLDYARQLEDEGFDFGIVVAGAFVRGIRDIGYKSTGTAINELIDNALQAGAKHIHVVMGFEGNSTKPKRLAIIDDGHGMHPTMLRASVLWGGTHRENDRTGFGRYGYGLPSSCISQGKRFTVFSSLGESDWNKVTIDVDAISNGDYSQSRDGRIVVPKPTPAALPDWVCNYIEDQIDCEQLGPEAMERGTVVVIEELDGLTYTTQDRLRRHLLETFGVTYRNYLRQANIYVQGVEVEAIDPLFLTPGFRYYDSYTIDGQTILDADRATALPPLVFDVKGEDKRPIGKVTLRYSYMPPTFGRIPADKLKERGTTNPRFQILKDYEGFIVCRAGRQIDVVMRCPWLTFSNNDRYWKVEIDFSPTLDHEFSVTTSKQQVVLSERMWNLLKEAGVPQAIEEMRLKSSQARATMKAERDKAKQRPSEEAMKEAHQFKTRKPVPPSPDQQKKDQEEWRNRVKKEAERTGKSYEEAEEVLLLEVRSHPYKVDQESMPGAPFYRVVQSGGQVVLWLNTAHRFYTDLYAGPGATRRTRAALEVLLLVMGECELESSSQRRLFYQSERAEWSKQLEPALDRLNQHDNLEDEESTRAAEAETAQMNGRPTG